ncbi:M23 family metallopeptidase [Sphingomonas mesophila]|uniref:M23 family metallopeptidase n=1 Tax=Sphingomonas mesophila TaxID=2303576 RepID=UPI000E56C3D4|nr:M23 family metallopeptidase [Sphingomonas mesophila]
MRTIGAVTVTAVLVSAFWIFFYNIRTAPGATDGRVAPAGDKGRVEAGAGNVTVAEGVVVGPSGLAIPVAGVSAQELVDTFTQARAGGARVHDAIDIMAAEGTPVVAAAAGTVEKLFNSKGGGGITAYVRSPDGQWIYYYAHLQRYAPGLAEGQKIERGAPIGFVGYTGNANPAGPHLHFAIHRMAPGEAWHEGSPINPYPLLAGKAVSR